MQLTTDEPEKAAAAFTVTLTAASVGGHVDLWLSGPGTLFAVPAQSPGLQLAHAPDPDQALDAAAAVHVCSQCAARRGLADSDLRAGAAISGATVLVEQLLSDGAQAVTY